MFKELFYLIDSLNMMNEQLGQNPQSPHPHRAKFVNRSSEKNILSITVTLKEDSIIYPKIIQNFND